jgi:CheY-like chemotaxis protein
MPQFTLFKRPSRLVFLDDDALFLQVLKVALPPDWRADLFMDSEACLAHLKANGIAWLQDEYKQQILLDKADDSAQGALNIIPGILDYWRQSPERYDLVHMATFDYAMPGLNGLDAFELLQDWPGRRVLLTGQADESIAVKAFNKGLIQQFIAKQSGNLRDSLLFQLPDLLEQPLPRHQVLWLQSLSRVQQQWLSEPSVVQELNEWIVQNDWVEYAVTHTPFGILGANTKGIVCWLQLEFESDLGELADLASKQGLDSKGLAKVRSGTSLVNTDLCLALDPARVLTTSSAFKLGSNSSQSEQNGHLPDNLLGALWPLGDSYNFSKERTYDTWKTLYPSKIIQ